MIKKRKIYEKYVKRTFDVIFACVFLFLLSPVLLLTALLVRIKLGAPVIFRQARGGLCGREFMILKFRTMADKRDGEGKLLPDSERTTRFGRFLRRTSIDELPQLFNVLAGEMSLVGPRPLIPNEKDMHYLRKTLEVYDASPGITGLAQVCGRDRLSDNRKAECDAIYVSNMCFSCDLYIIVSTVCGVLKKDGISDSQKTIT